MYVHIHVLCQFLAADSLDSILVSQFLRKCEFIIVTNSIAAERNSTVMYKEWAATWFKKENAQRISCNSYWKVHVHTYDKNLLLVHGDSDLWKSTFKNSLTSFTSFDFVFLCLYCIMYQIWCCFLFGVVFLFCFSLFAFFCLHCIMYWLWCCAFCSELLALTSFLWHYAVFSYKRIIALWLPNNHWSRFASWILKFCFLLAGQNAIGF